MSGFPMPRETPDAPEVPALTYLNFRQRAFVLQYVLGDDSVRGVLYKAYLAAGFDSKDQNSASAGASALMRDTRIRNAISELRSEL